MSELTERSSELYRRGFRGDFIATDTEESWNILHGLAVAVELQQKTIDGLLATCERLSAKVAELEYPGRES